jgi:hypothetical protein
MWDSATAPPPGDWRLFGDLPHLDGVSAITAHRNFRHIWHYRWSPNRLSCSLIHGLGTSSYRSAVSHLMSS